MSFTSRWKRTFTGDNRSRQRKATDAHTYIVSSLNKKRCKNIRFKSRTIVSRQVNAYNEEQEATTSISTSVSSNDNEAGDKVSFLISSMDHHSTLPMLDSHSIDSGSSCEEDFSDIEENDQLSIHGGDSDTEDIEKNIDELLNDNGIRDDRFLHGGTSLTVYDFSLDFLEFCRQSKISENHRCKILSLMSKYMPSPNNVPSTGHEVMVAVGLRNFHSTERICSSCHTIIVEGRCSSRECASGGIRLAAEETVDVVTFDVSKELELLCSQSLKLMQNYQEQARNETVTDRTDIVCGEVYQLLLRDHPSFFISIMLHSDGVPIYRSRTCSVWPILGAVIELPPMARARTQNVLLVSLWIGRSKPNFAFILEKLFRQLTHLKNVGVKIYGQQPVPILFPILLGDMPALADMVNFVQHTAYHACMFCTSRGQYCYRGRCVIFPNDETSVLRTPNDFNRYAQMAASHPHSRSIQTLGLRGVSEFSKILDIPMPYSIAIDGMHTSFLCHAKKLLLHFHSRMSKDQLQSLSKRLREIKYIHDVLRRPKAFNTVSRWKASEIRVFILYIGLPLMINILSPDDAGDLAVFTVIMRSMRDQWTGSQLQARAITLLIEQYIEHLERKQQDDLLPSSLLTITTHTHTHMPDQCLRFGRMEWQENFLFEKCLGYLKQFVKGPGGAASQIAIGFSCSFALKSLHQQQPIGRGHFLIDEANKIYGSNIFNNQSVIELFSPIIESSLRSSTDLGNAHQPVYFARLHKMFTTFHSFVYQRRGDQTCSYLVAYQEGSNLHYGYVMVYVLVNNRCLAILQPLVIDDRKHLSDALLTHPLLPAIDASLRSIYTFCHHELPSFSNSSQFVVCSIDDLHVRCFSVSVDTHLCISHFPCAYENN